MTAADGLEYIKSYHYDLVILDIQLPDGTGTGLLKRLREMRPHHAGTGADRAQRSGQQGGEFPGRRRRLCRSSLSPWPNWPSGCRPCCGADRRCRRMCCKAAHLEINRLTRQVKRDGKRIELSPKEYSLLEYLFLHSGRVLSRSMIVEKIWDQSFEGLTNIVDVYIGHLRRKIDEGHRAQADPHRARAWAIRSILEQVK